MPRLNHFMYSSSEGAFAKARGYTLASFISLKECHIRLATYLLRASEILMDLDQDLVPIRHSPIGNSDMGVRSDGIHIRKVTARHIGTPDQRHAAWDGESTYQGPVQAGSVKSRLGEHSGHARVSYHTAVVVVGLLRPEPWALSRSPSYIS